MSFQMSAFITPPHSLRLRDDVTTSSSTSSTSYPTSANGCVICPPNVGSCPQCSTGEECTLTSQTCNTCPKYRCVPASSSGSISGSAVGGIVGGVLGGVVALVIAIVLYYTLVYRKKHPRLNDDSDGYDSEYEMDSQVSGAGAGHESLYTDQSEKGRPTAQRTTSSSSVPGTKNHRLSAYESFMRPPGHMKNKRGGGRAGPRTRGGPDVQRRVPPGISAPGTISYDNSDMLSKRDSMATTMSTTNASNILPIAYIPGVTIRPTKNNTRSIFSDDNESVFTNFTGIDNASIVHERADANGKNTMTAVRAQPKLVNVTRIDEDIAEEDEDEEEIEVQLDHGGKHQEGQGHYAADASPFWSEDHSGSAKKDGSGSDSDSDSDVDSDIGEIKRATSTRKSPRRSVFDDNANDEHGSAFNGFESQEDDEDDVGSKSFVLDIGRES
ncbi:hypothetical protein JCM33374_g3217 [Metschnikowia sp. JCM 33374]|nr:hypothetical protein JCM33374_g3217 [Metschnikowia sp. JCM 33374]